VLEGITRDSVIRIARDKGIEVIETALTRDELYCADEVFLTGTAAELTPVREVDDRQIGAGSRGPITKTIQATFFDAVHGRDRKYESWLTQV
jgi:branched-chain amino acid aminotransferase